MQNMANSLHRSELRIWGIEVGNLRLKPYRLIEWASVHQNELMQNWKNLSEKGTGNFVKIEPLK